MIVLTRYDLRCYKEILSPNKQTNKQTSLMWPDTCCWLFIQKDPNRSSKVF